MVGPDLDTVPETGLAGTPEPRPPPPRKPPGYPSGGAFRVSGMLPGDLFVTGFLANVQSANDPVDGRNRMKYMTIERDQPATGGPKRTEREEITPLVRRQELEPLGIEA